MTTRTVTVYDAGVPRPLPLPAGSYIAAAAAGPENTLWLSDMIRGDLRIVSPQGELLNVLYPELPAGVSIFRLVVGADGTFLAVTGQDLRRFDRRGNVLWVWSPASAGLSLTLSTMTDLTRDAQGILTLNDTAGRRIVRLAEDASRLSAVWQRVIAANQGVRQKPGDATAWLELADAYEAQGSLEALRPALEQARDLRPADARTRERLLQVDVALLKAKSAAAEADFAALLKRFGPETAREAYSRTMKTLESLQDLVPHDGDVTRRVLALRKAMNAAESALTPPPRLPQVVEVALPALFPSLLQAYRARPAGTVTLLNDVGETLSDVQVDLFVPGFMDLPSSGPLVKRVAAGSQVKLDITALLGPRALAVEEDLPLQVLLTVRFRDATGPRSFELRRPLTLYRRTALTWDDSRKLGSFVTPNEEGLERAAFQMLAATVAEPRLVSATLQRAAALCDALGSLPLQYIPDPKSNFSLVSTDPGLIDTVRFPRTTLTLQGGDCDDSTALLASLLESTGIPTAILTSPGHVFLAFDTGEKPENAWLLQGEGLVTVEHGGSSWIPLESTDLRNGFVQSWSRASGLVAAYRGTPALEFLPVAELRATYPALPLPASTLPLPRPADAATLQLHQASQSALLAKVYEPQAAAMTKASLGLSGRDKSKATNKLAQLSLRYGQTEKAVAALTQVVAADPGYATAYLNLAVIRFDQGNKTEAQKWVAAAAKAAPGPTVTKFAEKLGMASNAVATTPRTDGSDGGRAGLDTGDLWVGD